MSTYILVHGAWLDSRCWHPVKQILEQAGHTVFAPDLPGHGTNQTPLSGLSLSAYADSIQKLAATSKEKPILVGHSMAGMVVSHCAETNPGAFKKLVYVAAYLPQSGESLTTIATTDADSSVGPAMRPAADWSTIDIAEESRRDIFFPDVTSDLADPLLASFRAEPAGPMNEPVALTEPSYGSVPRLYIRTQNDRAVSPALQERMLQATPTPTKTIATGHLPMLADPTGLAQILLEAAE